MGRNAKIVVTIGPSSEDDRTIHQLLACGMDVARLNFSHGTHETHAKRCVQLRAAATRLGKPLSILQDLQGPKVRVGVLPAPLNLEKDHRVLLYPEGESFPQLDRHQQIIPVDFPELFDSIKNGTRILLDDGRLVLSVVSHQKKWVIAEVKTGGLLTSNKGINLPGVSLDIPAFTAKDAEDLKFGLSLGIDYVAISFVRSAHDVLRVKQEIVCLLPTECPLLIAKLERPEALANLDSILDVADGVMVARGDLGVEMNPEDVPGAQKRIIQSANHKGKLVITATQMLESMLHNPIPTRAEASDVANAIFDGTDAVMLSAETAAGDYPIETVTMMDRIVCKAETDIETWGHNQELEVTQNDDAVALTRAARELAHDQDVAAVAVFTRTGRSAFLMAKTRPSVPILAFTPEIYAYNHMALAWGVQPHVVPLVYTVEDMFKCVDESLRNSGMVKAGQQVVIVCGFPISEMRPPNMILLHTLG